MNSSRLILFLFFFFSTNERTNERRGDVSSARNDTRLSSFVSEIGVTDVTVRPLLKINLLDTRC